MDAEETRLVGRRLEGRYELEDEIASGGMGTVWRARDEVLGRPVAVKVLHDHLARDPDLFDRFRLEAVAAARLTHPAVVKVFDTGIDGGVCFIVMELFDGHTLESLLDERGTLEPEEAARMIRSTLQGLGHAHRHGVVHRDVKPGNILIDRDGYVKVTDFGIAKAAFAGDDLTTTGNLLGTSRYLAPEQVTGGPVDARADLYSTGIVLYEALTGRTPFQADTHIATATMRLSKDPVPPRALRSGISRPLNEVVMRALARDPDDRYQSAEEMAEALERAVPSDGSPIPPPLVPAAEPEPGPSPVRSWFVVPLLVLLVAALAVGGLWILGQVLDDGQDPARNGGAEGSAPTALEAQAVRTYDPTELGGDESEHDDELGGATDGDPDTYWTTEGYENPGMDKEGVGIVVEIDEPSEVGALRLVTATPGFEFSVYASDTPDAFDLGAAPLASATAEPVTELDLEPAETRYLLIWLTELVPVDRYRAHVNEIEVFAP
ncbi:MAG: protein kinase domain-containing protein [Actinomycetota bacterium]